MQGSKIRLSPAEAALFCDAETILTKNRILQKTVELLSEVQEELVATAPSFIRELSPSPKISKGENYLGLPYVILDYPRIAKDDDLFFIRSMFWWGNFFSSTLQMAGNYKAQFENRLIASAENLASKHYAVGINADPWMHHFGSENYQPLSQHNRETFAAILKRQRHIKIAASWPLSEWDTAAIKLSGSWKFFVSLIT